MIDTALAAYRKDLTLSKPDPLLIRAPWHFRAFSPRWGQDAHRTLPSLPPLPSLLCALCVSVF
jgi:hypothetical protein